MGADCQTSGGYKQFVNIITADLNIIGQLRPGNKINFRLITMEKAIEKLSKLTDDLNSLHKDNSPAVYRDCFEKH